MVLRVQKIEIEIGKKRTAHDTVLCVRGSKIYPKHRVAGREGGNRSCTVLTSRLNITADRIEVKHCLHRILSYFSVIRRSCSLMILNHYFKSVIDSLFQSSKIDDWKMYSINMAV